MVSSFGSGSLSGGGYWLWGYFCILPQFHDIITDSASSFPLDFCSVDEEIEAQGNDSRYMTARLRAQVVCLTAVAIRF